MRDQVYLANELFTLQASDDLEVVTYERWTPNADGSYTVKSSNFPISEIGAQYVVIISHEHEIPDTIEGDIFYGISGLSIPINENIDDPEYVNEWYRKFGLRLDEDDHAEWIEKTSRSIEEFYKPGKAADTE